MRLGGLQQFSMIDYPDKICAIGFTQGCNFRCPYCHNPELVEPEQFSKPISDRSFFKLLKERVGKLDAVTITGGEPTLHSDLLKYLKKIKKIGYLIKLDTNGSNPNLLEKAIKRKLVDYVAMDIKSPLHKYRESVRMPIDEEKIRESINIIMRGVLPYEFRTTVVVGHLSKDDVITIGRTISGARLYILQKFVPTKTIDVNYLMEDTYTDEEFEIMRKELLRYVERCEVR